MSADFRRGLAAIAFTAIFLSFSSASAKGSNTDNPIQAPAPLSLQPVLPSIDKDTYHAAYTGTEFPEAAKKQGLQGCVLVLFDLLPDGSVTNVHSVTSAPSGIFDRAAVENVKREAETGVFLRNHSRPARNSAQVIYFRVPGKHKKPMPALCDHLKIGRMP